MGSEKRKEAVAEIEALLRAYNADPAGARLVVVHVPAGTRVLALEGSSPRDVKKRGYDQLRVTFIGTSDGMGQLGRQMAHFGPWGFERKEPSQAQQAPLGLDGEGEHG